MAATRLRALAVLLAFTDPWGCSGGGARPPPAKTAMDSEDRGGIAPGAPVSTEGPSGEELAKPLDRARLAGWPSRLLVGRGTLPRDDREFLRRVAEDTWRGISSFRDRQSGLPLDHVRFEGRSVAEADAHVGNYATTSSIGLHLIAIVAARELGFLSGAETEKMLRQVLETLQRLETHRGFCFNFYDITSLERTSDFLSFVDSAWLTAGLMVVRMAVPRLSEVCTRHIAQLDLRFFYDESERLMSHGYHVDRSARSPYHYGVLFTEARLGSLIAIGKGEAPGVHWLRLLETFPTGCTGEPASPSDAGPSILLDRAASRSCSTWRGLRFVPSWGGSMFEALMPTLVLDEMRLAPETFGKNDEVHATVQRLYALEELRLPVWGMSPSTAPSDRGYAYAEYGVPVLGRKGYPSGVVTPHAAALVLAVAPEAATLNLRKLVELYDVYGEFGFYDAVDPHSGEVVHAYLTLDQTMTLIALANHLEAGCIQKHFAADPIVQAALPFLDEKHIDEHGSGAR